MKPEACPRRQEMLARLILEDRTLPPTSEDRAHAEQCPMCARALTVAGALDTDLSGAFAEARRTSPPPLPPGPELERLLRHPFPAAPAASRPPPTGRWLILSGLVGLVGLLAILLWPRPTPPMVPNDQGPQPGAADRLDLAPPRMPPVASATVVAQGFFFSSGEDSQSGPLAASAAPTGRPFSCPGTGTIFLPSGESLALVAADFTLTDRTLQLRAGEVVTDLRAGATAPFIVQTRPARISTQKAWFRVAYQPHEEIEVECRNGGLVLETIARDRFMLEAGSTATIDRHGQRRPSIPVGESSEATGATAPPAAPGPESATGGAGEALLDEFTAEFRDAIKYGRHEETRAFLARIQNPNVRDHRSWTPIHEAAFRGRPEILKAVLESGADPNTLTDDGWSPLAEAAYMGHLEALTMLLAARATPDSRDALGWTPLFRAAQGDQSVAIERLLAAGADPAAIDDQGATVLHRCAEGNRPGPIAVLLAASVPINLHDRQGATPLHLAARHGAHEVVALLLRHGAAPNDRDHAGQTALHYATASGHRAIVRLLVAAGADLNPVDQEGNTPLTFARRLGDDDLTAWLTANGAH
jgi:uncharacterized protein